MCKQLPATPEFVNATLVKSLKEILLHKIGFIYRLQLHQYQLYISLCQAIIYDASTLYSKYYIGRVMISKLESCVCYYAWRLMEVL